jgi:hypothetical protein
MMGWHKHKKSGITQTENVRFAFPCFFKGLPMRSLVWGLWCGVSLGISFFKYANLLQFPSLQLALHPIPAGRV